MIYWFKIFILVEICIKIRYFLLKNCKNRPALGAPLPDPLAPGSEVRRPTMASGKPQPTPLHPLLFRNPGYTTGHP